jgi:hypothetical protein
MNPQEHLRQGAIDAMAKNGGKLFDIPNGPKMEVYNPLELAQALEYEVNRCGPHGWDQISINMTLDDAMKLASHLRQNPIIRSRV